MQNDDDQIVRSSFYARWSISRNDCSRCWPSFLNGQPNLFLPGGTWCRLIIMLVLFLVVVILFFVMVNPVGALVDKKYETDFIDPQTMSFPDVTACQYTNETFTLIFCTLPNGDSCLGPAYWTDVPVQLPESGSLELRDCITAHFYGLVLVTQDMFIQGANLILVFNITSASYERAWTGLNVYFHSSPFSTDNYLDRHTLQAGVTLLTTLEQVIIDDLVTYDAKTQPVVNIEGNAAQGIGIGIVDTKFSSFIQTEYQLQSSTMQLWSLASPWAGVIGIFPTISIIVMIVLAAITRPCCVCHLYDDDGSSCGFTYQRDKNVNVVL